MGVVFRAVQEPLGREVALKVLPPEFSANASRVKRFQREAEAVSKLDHPHIIPIYAFGKFGGFHYYAMKLVKRRDAREDRRHDAGRHRVDVGAPGHLLDQFASRLTAARSAGPRTTGNRAVIVRRTAGDQACTGRHRPPDRRPQAGSAGSRRDSRPRPRRPHPPHRGQGRRRHRARARPADPPPRRQAREHHRRRARRAVRARLRPRARRVRSRPLRLARALRHSVLHGARAGFRRSRLAATDVWGLGVTLYEVLVAQAALHRAPRATPSSTRSALTTPPIAPLAQPGRVARARGRRPPRDRARARPPLSRHARLRRRPHRVLEGRPPSVLPEGRVSRVYRQVTRHRIPTPVLLLVVVVVAALCIWIGLHLAG